MDAATAIPTVRFNRFLPYWAVLRTDVRQVLRSWAYWLWVILFGVLASSHMLYRYAVAHESGLTALKDNSTLTAATQTSNVIRVILTASLAVIAFLSVSSISSERATVADSVLSRGISRRAYFLAKWNARLVTVLGTFMVLSLSTLIAYRSLLGETGEGLSIVGSFLGVLMVAAGLGVVVSGGVTVGAISPSTLMGITIAWVMLYGGLTVMSFLPETYPTPGAVLSRLQNVMLGQYSMDMVWRVLGVSVAASLFAAIVGLVVFNRKDV